MRVPRLLIATPFAIGAAAAALPLAELAAQEVASDTLLTVGHYLDLESVSDPQVSPDGSSIVYTRRWVNKLADQFETTLWIVRADGSHNRVFAKGSSPRWSPDGTRIAYLADGEPKGAQIFVRWVDGDAGATQVTRVAEAPADIHWSPDGKSIGFSMFVPKPPVWAIDMPKPPDSAHWTRAPRLVETMHFREDRKGFQDPGFRHLFVVSTEGGPARQITSGDWNVGARFDGLSGVVGWDWLPDGSALVVDGLQEPDAEFHYRESRIARVAVATGTVTPLTTEPGNWTSPVVSPDGAWIAYTGAAATDQTYHTTGLYLMRADGSGRRALTADLDRDVGDVHWAADGKSLYFTAEDRGARHLYAVAVAGSAPRQITSGVEFVTLGSVAKTGVAAIARATATRPAELARVSLGGRQADVVALTTINDAVLSRMHLATVEEVWYTSSSGARIQGWIAKPPSFDPARKYPLILEIHGGPHGAYNGTFNYMVQNFAANNYVVLEVNPRGSTAYGSAFGDAINKNYPGVDYDDLMAGVDTVIRRGYVDDRNLFVSGCSGGGVLSSWVIGHTTRFAAAAVRCPVIDWISMAGETDIPLFTYEFFDKPFWEAPDSWLAHSPLMYVGHVKTPVLLMTGELDRRTPMPQTEEYYVALQMRHVPTALLRFEGEYHGTGSKPTNFMRTQLYMMSWFKRYTTPAQSASAGH